MGCEDAPCRVTRVQPNSAAEKAGFNVGDVIVKYNGFDVSSMTELTELIAKHKATQETDVVIRRGGELIERKVTLGKWD